MVKPWDVAKIGDFLDFKNGLNKGKEFFGYGTPIVNYTDVYKNRGLMRGDIHGRVCLSPDEIQRFNVCKNDVFFTRTSETPDEVGLSSVLLEEVKNGVFSGFVLRGRPKNDMFIPEYCKYCFSTERVRNAIVTGCTYTTRALTNGKQLSSIEIAVPPKPEQERIALVLSEIDCLISTLEILIKKKTAIKQGAMQELLSGKKRLPGFDATKSTVKLSDVAEIKDGTHGTYNRVSDGALLLSAKNIFNNHMEITENESMISTDDYLSIVSNGFPHCGDILLSCVGTIGRCCIYSGKPKVAFQRSVAFIRSKGINAEYLLYLLQSDETQKQLKESANASAQGGVYLGALANLTIEMVNDPNEQTAIASVLSNMGDEIEKLETKLEKYRQVKQGMMQQLLTGKIRLV